MDTALEALARRRISEAKTVERVVVEALREAVLKGVLKAGQRLRQDELAATFGVSRMPIREALRQLESEGLVRLLPHRGAVVTSLTAEEVLEIYEIRSLLESHAMALAVPRLTDDRIRQLEHLLAQMKEEKDPLQQVDLREAFYQTLYEASGRSRLVALIMQLRKDVGRYFLSKQIPLSRESHEELLRLCRLRDGEAASRHIRHHLEEVSRMLQGVVDASPAAGAAPEHAPPVPDGARRAAAGRA